MRAREDAQGRSATREQAARAREDDGLIRATGERGDIKRRGGRHVQRPHQEGVRDARTTVATDVERSTRQGAIEVEVVAEGKDRVITNARSRGAERKLTAVHGDGTRTKRRGAGLGDTN